MKCAAKGMAKGGSKKHEARGCKKHADEAGQEAGHRWHSHGTREEEDPAVKLQSSYQSELLKVAMRASKFASSKAGAPCHARFGGGNASSPFPATCSDKVGACFLWCDCSSKHKVNGSCPVESESASSLRSLSLVPEEFRCERNRSSEVPAESRSSSNQRSAPPFTLVSVHDSTAIPNITHPVSE